MFPLKINNEKNSINTTVKKKKSNKKTYFRNFCVVLGAFHHYLVNSKYFFNSQLCN